MHNVRRTKAAVPRAAEGGEVVAEDAMVDSEVTKGLIGDLGSEKDLEESSRQGVICSVDTENHSIQVCNQVLV